MFTFGLFCFSGASLYSTRLALNSSENVRGNYLSDDDIDDHMNLQLTLVYSAAGVYYIDTIRLFILLRGYIFYYSSIYSITGVHILV